ncbi:hypothetical protein ACVRZS_07350 [Streptococcus ferus]|uniref:Uncharacterized protein n=1 Tax=Streptococcus ferus TaxID=1345 RepID=A0A2X3W5V6_9STRE|nr:hypothetical protein [Streptococcus ferus]SQF39113.1 Uncharacterised protein [Streptococcus ferus]
MEKSVAFSKVYTITENGIKSFYYYIQTEIEPRKNKWDFMVRMYFADNLPIQKQKEIIDVELMRQEDSLEQLLELQKLLEKRMNRFQKFSLETGLKQKEVLIEELRQLKKEIEKNSLSNNKAGIFYAWSSKQLAEVEAKRHAELFY